MRRFMLLAATAVLITAGLDGCSRHTHPLRPKEPHALIPGAIGRPLAQNPIQNANPA
jgi:hypothetical protein